MDNKYFHILSTYLFSEFIEYKSRGIMQQTKLKSEKLKFEGNKSRLSHNLIEHSCFCINFTTRGQWKHIVC
jgi:hypothetical protein